MEAPTAPSSAKNPSTKIEFMTISKPLLSIAKLTVGSAETESVVEGTIPCLSTILDLYAGILLHESRLATEDEIHSTRESQPLLSDLIHHHHGVLFSTLSCQLILDDLWEFVYSFCAWHFPGPSNTENIDRLGDAFATIVAFAIYQPDKAAKVTSICVKAATRSGSSKHMEYFRCLAAAQRELRAWPEQVQFMEDVLLGSSNTGTLFTVCASIYD